jgi:hypothetical protein
VIDGARLANRRPRAIPGINWQPDGQSFFYLRQQKPSPACRDERYQNSRVWLTGSRRPRARLARIDRACRRASVSRARISRTCSDSGSRHAIAAVRGRAARTALYTAPLETVGRPTTPWVRSATPRTRTDFAVRGEEIYPDARKSPRYDRARRSRTRRPVGRDRRAAVGAGALRDRGRERRVVLRIARRRREAPQAPEVGRRTGERISYRSGSSGIADVGVAGHRQRDRRPRGVDARKRNLCGRPLCGRAVNTKPSRSTVRRA